MSSLTVQRRRFLKTLGLGALSLPFMSLLERSVVDAQTMTSPMRLVMIYTQYGGIWDNFRPQGVTTNDFALTPASLTYQDSVLAPLSEFASKMTIVEGLALTSELMPGDGGAKTLFIGHDRTCPAMFTGGTMTEVMDGSVLDVYPGSASLDFTLGQMFGQNVPVRQIQLGIGGYVGGTSCLSFNESGQRLPGFGNPNEVYDLLFGGVSSMPMDTGAAQRQLAQRSSVLHAVQASAQRLRGRLAGTERAKLDEHLAALSDIETRLQSSSGPNPTSCTVPSHPDTSVTSPDVITASNVMFPILSQALACDRVRYATIALNLGGPPIPGVCDPSITDMHGQVAHGIDTVGDPGVFARRQMDSTNRWYATQIAAFMRQLQAITEPGGTVLDNTLIVWAQDFGEDVHGGLNMPFVLLGGAQNRLRMGRYLNVAPSRPYPSDYTGDPLIWQVYQPHNKLLVSIMNAFGVDTSTVGSTDSIGPLTGLV